jgi:cell division protein FtsL
MENRPDEFNEENNKETETTGKEPENVPQKQKKRISNGLIALIAIVTLVAIVAFSALAVTIFMFLKDLEPDTRTNLSDATTSVQAVVTEVNGSKHFSIEEASTLPDSGNKVALSTMEIAGQVGPATVSIIAEVSYGSIYG